MRSSCFCIGVVFLLAGCTAPAPTVQRVPERCLGPETTIVARMPTPGGESATTARGVYIEANTVLSVAHALPSNATAEGFAGLRRDDERHLLLLQAETCGTPLAIAAGGMAAGDALYDCTTKGDPRKCERLRGLGSSGLADFVAHGDAAKSGGIARAVLARGFRQTVLQCGRRGSGGAHRYPPGKRFADRRGGAERLCELTLTLSREIQTILWPVEH